MSKDQTFRSEDNAFLPLRRRQLSRVVRNDVKQMEAESQAPKKTLNLNTPVSSLLQVCPLLILTAESGKMSGP
jgi:hypothetical protein